MTSLKSKKYVFLNFVEKYVRLKGKKKVHVIITIIIEYASSSKYAKILNMAWFSIYKRYTAFWICQNMLWQSSEYGRLLNMQELHSVLKCHNMAKNV